MYTREGGLTVTSEVNSAYVITVYIYVLLRTAETIFGFTSYQQIRQYLRRVHSSGYVIRGIVFTSKLCSRPSLIAF